MRKQEKYRIAVFILSAVVLIQAVLLILATRPRGIPKPRLPPLAVKGRIAIVIDDWGYHTDTLSLLDGLSYPITAAILPGLRYSGAVSEQLHKRGLEVILHLPMEPHEKSRLEQDTIMVGFSAGKVKKILKRDLDDIPYARGVSNHMGSRATEDAGTMKIIFGELKSRRLYFLDSLASSKSVCSVLAKDEGLAFARRDIFLDNRSDPDYIRSQAYKLKMKAGLYGSAIGIGHDRRSTLEVLRKVMPQLAAEGYRFVFVSELVKTANR